MADDQKAPQAAKTKKDVTFDPGQHLTNIKGNPYLPVAWRLAWIRAEYPESIIETTLHDINETGIIFRCEATKVDEGGEKKGFSTGWGFERWDSGFSNPFEKAETRSIGRALAALGYGTQFSGDDFEESALADAPPNMGDGGGWQGGGSRGGGSATGDALATTAQRSMIQYKARQANMEPEALVQFIKAETGKEFSDLTKREASRVIDALGDRQAPQQMRRGE